METRPALLKQCGRSGMARSRHPFSMIRTAAKSAVSSAQALERPTKPQFANCSLVARALPADLHPTSSSTAASKSCKRPSTFSLEVHYARHEGQPHNIFRTQHIFTDHRFRTSCVDRSLGDDQPDVSGQTEESTQAGCNLPFACAFGPSRRSARAGKATQTTNGGYFRDVSVDREQGIRERNKAYGKRWNAKG